MSDFNCTKMDSGCIEKEQDSVGFYYREIELWIQLNLFL